MRRGCFLTRMKTLTTALGAVVLATFLSSCSFSLLKGKYARNSAATSDYIAGKSGQPGMNIEGLWYSPEWGMVVLNQEPSGKLTGVFQDYYHVRGVVRGRSAYIALVDDDWTEYTVELTRKNSEVLTGFSSPDVPFLAASKVPLTLVRVD